MKTITLIITSLFANATLVLADGIPVNHKTGEVTIAHTIVSLTAEQIEETQTLGTFTLTPEQWREIRAKSPQCPKRYNNILPVTWNDCTCGVEDGYVIALSRDRIAVLHDGDSVISVESVRYELFKDRRVTTLRMNESGEFHLGGTRVPFPTLLKAFAVPPEGAKRDEHGKLQVTVSEYGSVYQCLRGLDVELPMGAKPSDAVFASRLKQIAAAADQMGFWVLFSEKESASDE
ncbi:MAG: hypothetical protein ABIS50_20775 [Luteolibacter sp.]|uniref:hypothetical protein n=1 Tax=Luteolibacter sp. TaxID=1962973 RepID=UPI003262EC75